MPENNMTDDQVTPTAPVADDVDARVTMLEKQLAEHIDGWKRAKADYLNLKKQTDKEKQDIAHFAVAQTILKFLPIYDNLNRAVKHIPAELMSQDWAQGISHIRKQFEDGLDKMGLKLIPTIGQQFDPLRHHAVSKVKQNGVSAGTIVDELKAGFMAEDRVLEPAQVVVAE